MQNKIGIKAKSNSEFVGCCVYFCYRCCFEKVPELDNKNVIEFVTKKRGMSAEDALMEQIKKFKEFVAKDGH